MNILKKQNFVVNYINDDQLFENNNSIVTFAFDGENVEEFFPLGFKNEQLDLSLGKANKINTLGQEDYPFLYIIGLGKNDDKFEISEFRKLIKTFLKDLDENVNIDLITTSFVEKQELAKLLTEEYLENKYTFSKITNQESDEISLEINLCSDVNLEEVIEESSILSTSSNITKELVNMPSNYLTPYVYSELVKKLTKDTNISVDIKSTEELKTEGYGLLTNVNAASQFECYLITLEYNGDKLNNNYRTIVGKGITFDTGGMSLKTGVGLQTMKADMGGSATALGVILGAEKLSLNENIRVILGVTENSISASSYKVDSVLVSKLGKTVEVINTDAEGRLVLADLIAHAQLFETDEIISLSTLTGTNFNYFGRNITPIHAHENSGVEKLVNIANSYNEFTWYMPLNHFGNLYRKPLLDSKVADLRNLGAGHDAIVAGVFLNEFIADENIKFIHIDLAGQAFVDGLGTGKMVKPLIKYFDK